MNIAFQLESADGQLIPEKMLRADPSAGRELLSTARAMGVLEIGGEAGELGAVFYDRLEQMIVTLCFQAAVALPAGEEVVYSYLTEPGEVRFTPDEEEVSIVEEGEETLRFPRGELAPALRACGDRYLALLEQLFASSPGDEERLVTLRLAARAANGEPPPSAPAGER